MRPSNPKRASPRARDDWDRDQPDRDGDELAEDVEDRVTGDQRAGGQLATSQGRGRGTSSGQGGGHGGEV